MLKIFDFNKAIIVNPNKRIVISSNDFFAVTKNDEVGTPYNEDYYKAELNWKDPKTHKQTRPYVWRGYLTEDAKVVCPGIKPNDYFRIGDVSNTKQDEYALAANGCAMTISANVQLKTEGYEGYHMGRTYFRQSENGTIKYNPITYCINTINRKDVSEEQRNVSKALYKYSEASKAYFG
ncbi:MAG: hypothetical protein J6M07_12005 [Ruminococcus sp.]|nr:hypothetical protein [Ruminococcus sp.]